MTGMELDSIQQTTRTPLTTSLGTTGIQKSDLLDGIPQTNPSYANTPSVMTPVIMTPPDKSGLFNDTPHEEKLPPDYLYTIDLITENT